MGIRLFELFLVGVCAHVPACCVCAVERTFVCATTCVRALECDFACSCIFAHFRL